MHSFANFITVELLENLPNPSFYRIPESLESSVVYVVHVQGLYSFCVGYAAC